MIKLTDLLKEVQNKPKAIIMAGGASVGKSTILKTIESQLKGFENLNADKYVEDKDSPMFGNLSAASTQIRKRDFPNRSQLKMLTTVLCWQSNIRSFKTLSRKQVTCLP